MKICTMPLKFAEFCLIILKIVRIWNDVELENAEKNLYSIAKSALIKSRTSPFKFDLPTWIPSLCIEKPMHEKTCSWYGCRATERGPSVALQIVGAGPPPEEIAEKIEGSITSAIPDAEVIVRLGTPGHFEIRVVSSVFEGKTRVQQQQTVYRAINHLLLGKNPPVHAVDRMECLTP